MTDNNGENTIFIQDLNAGFQVRSVCKQFEIVEGEPAQTAFIDYKTLPFITENFLFTGVDHLNWQSDSGEANGLFYFIGYRVKM